MDCSVKYSQCISICKRSSSGEILKDIWWTFAVLLALYFWVAVLIKGKVKQRCFNVCVRNVPTFSSWHINSLSVHLFNLQLAQCRKLLFLIARDLRGYWWHKVSEERWKEFPLGMLILNNDMLFIPLNAKLLCEVF